MALSEIETEHKRIPASEGITLAADCYGDPGARPALLFHGGGQTRHSWSGTAQRLAESGWYAINIDLRGHGQSDWDPTGAYHHESFRNDVTAIARTLDEAPVLIGASLGGISSLLAIHDAGNSLARALVLVDIATRMETTGTHRIMEFMRGGLNGFASLDEVADAVAAYNPHRPRPKDVSGLEKNLRRGENGRYHWHWDPDFLTVDPKSGNKFVTPASLDEAAASLTIPTLLVRGKMSDLLSEDGARVFLELVPHADFADVSGAGHMVAGDRNDLFSEAVLEFLERNGGAE
ncbi:MAG: alpha/beta hydrolase [bacterium]|nr:alpha/beta hydrolase [Deltaproteobacteria bacterium]MCP4906621.1 alpha/beta hydrolase [bacterium]